jgi:hypothetical protein
MESSALDRPRLASHLATIGDRLRALLGLLDAGRGEGGENIRAAVASALGALEDAQSLVVDPRESTRVPCPFCGTRVMPAATLCLSCWRRLDASMVG